MTYRLPTIVAERDDDDENAYLVTVMWPDGLRASKCESVTAHCGEDAIEKMARMENIDDYAFRVR